MTFFGKSLTISTICLTLITDRKVLKEVIVKNVKKEVNKEELLGDLLKVAEVRNSPEEMYRFIKERVIEAGKRDIVRKSSEVLKNDFVVVTDRNRVNGFYVNLNAVKFLPPEVQSFFFMMMDALGCKYIVK